MKFLRTIALSAVLFATSAYAQSAQAPTPVAALPQAPSPATIITTSPNATTSGAVATTNQVYIDQSGQNVDVNIVQYGSGNLIGSATDPIFLRGDNQSVVMMQTGNYNSINASVVSDTGTNGVAAVTLRQIGDNNSSIIRCGNASTDSSCNQLNMNARFTGNYNAFRFHGSGSNIVNQMDVTGNNNTINMEITSPNASQTVQMTGDFNTINSTQTDLGGLNGHSLWLSVVGTGNSITAQQYGPTSTVINVQTVGNNGSINIKTGH
jgi:hypothetical protein